MEHLSSDWIISIIPFLQIMIFSVKGLLDIKYQLIPISNIHKLIIGLTWVNPGFLSEKSSQSLDAFLVEFIVSEIAGKPSIEYLFILTRWTLTTNAWYIINRYAHTQWGFKIFDTSLRVKDSGFVFKWIGRNSNHSFREFSIIWNSSEFPWASPEFTLQRNDSNLRYILCYVN